MEDFFYKKVIAYQKSKTFVMAIYALVKKFPDYERYALGDQSRRAAVSIPSNIAEGLGRISIKERIHFIEIAYSSLNEVTCQMDIAQALNYITSEELDNIERMSAELAKILSGLRQSLINKIR